VSVGVHEKAEPADTRRRFPAARIGRSFIRPLKRGDKPDLRDGGVHVSYKPSPEEVAAGRWTAVHREIGEWLADHPWAGIIVHHEPEGGRST
jgi:hypothetical protein